MPDDSAAPAFIRVIAYQWQPPDYDTTRESYLEEFQLLIFGDGSYKDIPIQTVIAVNDLDQRWALAGYRRPSLVVPDVLRNFRPHPRQ